MMHSLGIDGGKESRGQLANPGSPGKMAVKTEYVYVCLEDVNCSSGQLFVKSLMVGTVYIEHRTAYLVIWIVVRVLDNQSKLQRHFLQLLCFFCLSCDALVLSSLLILLFVTTHLLMSSTWQVHPVNHCSEASINRASGDLVQKHRTQFPTDRILAQVSF